MGFMIYFDSFNLVKFSIKSVFIETLIQLSYIRSQK
jgi:hypothetical protein